MNKVRVEVFNRDNELDFVSTYDSMEIALESVGNQEARFLPGFTIELTILTPEGEVR